ncbi:hypothetical protein SAMN04488505_102768 [Chitinophaga rupis]|uniref:Uncharacterized protein n=1 Tax=Chitinophaga rupis TaxID=573321 RepID=A0A1H7RY51_9BACT|nr:hypothetical protein SAMN04488505_102768 [Chitinophaga rupis]
MLFIYLPEKIIVIDVVILLNALLLPDPGQVEVYKKLSIVSTPLAIPLLTRTIIPILVKKKAVIA